MRSWPPASTATVPLARLARCAAASMPRASPETIDEAGVAEFARDPLGEFHAGRRRRCASRRCATIGRGERARACRARRAAAARRRSCAAAPDSPARRARRSGCRALRAPCSSRSASSREQMRAGRARAAAPRQLRQRVERGARAAAMIEQGAEGARADIVAADEAQPVEPLLVGQTHARCELVRQRTPGAEHAQRRADHNG